MSMLLISLFASDTNNICKVLEKNKSVGWHLQRPPHRSIVWSRAVVPTGVRDRQASAASRSSATLSRIVVSHQDAAFVALKSRLEARGKADKAQTPSNADHLSHCERTAARQGKPRWRWRWQWGWRWRWIQAG